MNQRAYSLLVALSFLPIFLLAQPLAVTMIPMNDASAWEISDSTAQFSIIKGKPALQMKQGTALLQGIELRDGVVEADIMPGSGPVYAGICFRAKDGEMLELIYLRFHQSGQVDAIQYTPRYNGQDSWQLYPASGFQAMASFKPGEWNHLQVKFEGSRAWVGVNGNPKVMLYVPELLRAPRKGKIGFWAMGEAAFSNLSYYKLPDVVLMAAQESKQEYKSITSWQLSPAYNADSLDWRAYPAAIAKWQTVNAKATGLVNIAPYRQKRIVGRGEKNSLDVVYAKTTITAEKEEVRALQFDYSDQIQIFINGQPLFSGDNSFQSKGPSHRGQVNAGNNVLSVPLKKGSNELLIAVADRDHGWGYIFQWQ